MLRIAVAAVTPLTTWNAMIAEAVRGETAMTIGKPRAFTDAFWATAMVTSPSVATRGSPSDWDPMFRALDSRLVVA